MGVSIERPDTTTVHIEGVGRNGLVAPQGDLDLGNSGTGMRLITGLLCGQPFDTRLVGDESLSQRPMKRVITPLTMMGGRIDSNHGMPPLSISGGHTLHGIDYQVPVASAQVKSAIMLAALYASGDTTITEPAVTRDHTERMLRTMGVRMAGEGLRIRLPGQQSLQAGEVDVPGDLSSAAFLILAALLASNTELTIRNVGVNPTRTGVIEILRDMGGDIRLTNPQMFGEEPVADLTVRSSNLKAIDIGPERVSLAIDEFPVLFVAAGAAEGISRLPAWGNCGSRKATGLRLWSRAFVPWALQPTKPLMAPKYWAAASPVEPSTVSATIASRWRLRSRPAWRKTTSGLSTLPPRRYLVSGIRRMRRFGGAVDHAGGIGGPLTASVPVLALDGPSGSGKGTVARKVALALGWHLLDSGSLYRLLGMAADRSGVALDAEADLAGLAGELDIEFSGG